MPNQELAERMRRLAELATEHAKDEFQTDLDYSEESLQLVDDILGNLHNDVTDGTVSWFSTGPTEEQVSMMSMVYGACVGEVVRRRWGGKWDDVSPLSSVTESSINLHVRGTHIFPTSKVSKRLVNGAVDGLEWYYIM